MCLKDQWHVSLIASLFYLVVCKIMVCLKIDDILDLMETGIFCF